MSKPWKVGKSYAELEDEVKCLRDQIDIKDAALTATDDALTKMTDGADALRAENKYLRHVIRDVRAAIDYPREITED